MIENFKTQSIETKCIGLYDCVHGITYRVLECMLRKKGINFTVVLKDG